MRRKRRQALLLDAEVTALECQRDAFIDNSGHPPGPDHSIGSGPDPEAPCSASFERVRQKLRRILVASGHRDPDRDSGESPRRTPKRWGPRVRATPMLLLVIVAAAVLSGPPLATAAGAVALVFESYGTFFSEETSQALPADPQVFVRAPDAAAGIGPQNISHAAGFAPAPIAAAPDTPLYTALGQPLGITLGRWLAAQGAGEITPVNEHGHAALVRVSFTGLVPGGAYSLFAVTFQAAGNTFAPLDGVGLHNFVALSGGTANVTMFTPFRLTHANAVLLLYHSDGRAHGISRGDPGVTVHHQLIARLP